MFIKTKSIPRNMLDSHSPFIVKNTFLVDRLLAKFEFTNNLTPQKLKVHEPAGSIKGYYEPVYELSMEERSDSEDINEKPIEASELGILQYIFQKVTADTKNFNQVNKMAIVYFISVFYGSFFNDALTECLKYYGLASNFDTLK